MLQQAELARERSCFILERTQARARRPHAHRRAGAATPASKATKKMAT
jgi:hypothetical protein